MNRGKSIIHSIAHSTLQVLIVDDEVDICYLLSGMLRQKKIKTSYVNTLSDAELLLKKEVPQVIFLDNHLPDGLGMDFISYIKKYYPLTKIAMITANDTYADRQKASTQGADFFISKPFSRQTIYNVVTEATS